MGSFARYAENEILDHVFKNAAFAQPTNLYVALSTTDPLNDGTGITEPVGNAYARVLCNVWNAAALGLTKNTNVVTFPTPTGSWGTIAHFALFDALTAGNMIGWGPLATAKAITTGDTPSFAAGDITVTLD